MSLEEEGLGDADDELDGPATTPWISPDDRLWRHPSEVGFLRSARDAKPTPWSLGLLSGAIGAILVFGLMAVAGVFRPPTVLEERAVPLPTAAKAGGADIPTLAARARPAIVKVEVRSASGESSASGVIFRDDGHVLTNAHVVEGASELTVQRADGERLPGRVVGADPDTDLAVVKIEGADLPVVTLGRSTGLRVGETAIAIGSPLGLDGGPSVSVGVISALSRSVRGEDGKPLLDMIQTDASIAPGSSGGALLDMSGAVVGITTAIAIDSRAGGESLGFATPVEVARDVAHQLIDTGHVVHAWLGIEGDDVVGGSDGADGALVRQVLAGSPAQKAGILPGDVITSLEGKPVKSMLMLMVNLRSHSPGDEVSVELTRDGELTQLRTTLVERPN
ncbi:MAG TPA: trypsin-like peptidase domain-containing protein [Acidimicrobiales bacterium]|nr:trypsin-like peptidase domain-containing protein [Acidimicrobiales bacterium]